MMVANLVKNVLSSAFGALGSFLQSIILPEGTGGGGGGAGAGGSVASSGGQEAVTFKNTFERTYGNRHPKLFEGSFQAAVESAGRQEKLLFMYLHCEMAAGTDVFCKNVFANEFLTSMVDEQNYITFAGDITHRSIYEL